ncbi:MAG TPA: NAD(P)/FAD-dependent oxidoreductase [Candidatus Limnocylindrales bacterium]|nr:NAD(P)/FAD-dependent oxidoreductase [Candidatus Limnocylindrales bacterium]
MTAWDAVVVGGGHNGLVCAAYLARSGLRTLVLERREEVGGAAGTTELLPGVRVPALAHTVGRLRPSVVRDLRLAGHGLSLLAPDVRVFAAQPDARGLTLWADRERSIDELRRWSPADAEAYAAFDARLQRFGRFMARLGGATPPDPKDPRVADALMAARLGLGFKGLGRREGRELLRVLPMAVADFVAEAFEHDTVRAVLAVRGVRQVAMGPWSAGTTAWLLTDSDAAQAGAAGETVFARGGPGALAQALASAVRAAGGEVRTGAEVAAVTSRADRATGVALADGEEIEARAVVSGLDPKRTLLGLLDPVAIGPTLAWRTSNLRLPGVVAKVNLALAELPDFPGTGAHHAERLGGRILVGATGVDDLERAFDAAKYGRLSESPLLEATIPSLLDDSLVAEGASARHVMSVIAQWMPYHRRDGSWDDPGERDALGERVLRALEAVAPGIGALVVARQVLTPLDLEREYGLTEGHPLHGEPGLDQFFAWRPFLGGARYRLPLDGLSLCSAGAHPGGGITGAPGANAAREVMADLGRR